MNLKDIYTFSPRYDSLLQIDVENHNVNDILPDFQLDENAVIGIYGVSQALLNAHICKLSQKAIELREKIRSKLSSGELWDIQIKPIFLFDTLETLTCFYDFSNLLTEEQFSEMIDQMQLKYNVPWESVTLLDDKKTRKIIKYYERRYLL